MTAPARDVLEHLLPREELLTFAPRAGWPELPLAAPATPERAAEVLRFATRERLTVLPLGLGSRLLPAAPPAHADLVLSSARLSGIVAYEPADGTLTARAGTTHSELVRATGERHHFSPEVSRPESSTLGGTLAAGASGLDRLRFGPLRHQVLGMTALLPDGTLVKSGGRVVKNVTGYDLHRLWCGSQGTLCFLLEATLRLYPRPAAEVVLRASFPRREAALERAQAVARNPIQALALVLAGRGARWELALVLSGREELVRFELERARELLPAAEVLEGEAARRARAEQRERERAGASPPPLALACRPSQLAGLLERLDAAARERRAELGIRCHPLLASAAVEVEPETPDVVQALERLVAGAAHVQWRGRRASSAPTAGAARLMQRLKHALDPGGVFPSLAFLHDGS